MALKDISWGAVVVGAAAVTAFVAMSPAAVLAPLVELGVSKAAVFGGAAIVGGIAGEFVSDLLKRGRDACATLVAPRR